ncbi:MAG: DUF763 domain-containing protein [Candidatus Desulfofervidaceae bacterium]|nr:DUF763 domain-containing protein [Candidatus Desulfofervidaceae bacterium]MDL1970763.1 DUF763 domain-containing protein [Candidatus Desulfofervidaceae bacterium]
MQKTGTAYLPLHGGKAPAWLFQRMVKLAREIIYILCLEYGRKEVLCRLSDPFWFQAFGCVLGFDWHSSGVTTTVCGAIKEALKDVNKELGIFVVGGKGKIALKTPQELEKIGNRLGLEVSPLIYASRLTAKVDNVALQDGYQLYHHTLVFTTDGAWSVIQQGMNPAQRYARRYHWLGEQVKSFVCEPHSAICAVKKERLVLNLVAQESEATRKFSIDLVQEKPEKISQEWQKIANLYLPNRHYLLSTDIDPKRLQQNLTKAYSVCPQDFESLLNVKGIGAKTLRALALIAEIIYGAKPSFKDPARFAFAHGGKDGHPYPVNRRVYDQSIEILKEAVNAAKIGYTEKMKALKRLHKFNL